MQKSKRIKHLERKCAELAALAQRRLEASAQLRGNSSVSMHGTGKARPASAGTFQGSMWSARETRKSKVRQNTFLFADRQAQMWEIVCGIAAWLRGKTLSERV